MSLTPAHYSNDNRPEKSRLGLLGTPSPSEMELPPTDWLTVDEMRDRSRSPELVLSRLGRQLAKLETLSRQYKANEPDEAEIQERALFEQEKHTKSLCPTSHLFNVKHGKENRPLLGSENKLRHSQRLDRQLRKLQALEQGGEESDTHEQNVKSFSLTILPVQPAYDMKGQLWASRNSKQSSILNHICTSTVQRYGDAS